MSFIICKRAVFFVITDLGGPWLKQNKSELKKNLGHTFPMKDTFKCILSPLKTAGVHD